MRSISFPIWLALTMTTCLSFGVATPVLADDDESDWVTSLKNTSPEPGSAKLLEDESAGLSEKERMVAQKKRKQKNDEPTKVDEENDLATINSMNPADLRSHASAHLKVGELEQAIKLVEHAIELQPEDTDGRQIYADALEQKYMAQDVRDPHLFNQCIKQWYYLYKSAEYPEMGNLAAKHLKDLTGKSPYVWPTAKMYLNRTLMPEPDTANGDLVKSDSSNGKSSNENTASVASEEPSQIH